MTEVRADVQILVKPEDVNEAISKAVLESTLGERVKEAVLLFCKQAARSPEYDPIGMAVKDFLAKRIDAMLGEEPYISQIHGALRKELDVKLPELVKSIVARHVKGY